MDNNYYYRLSLNRVQKAPKRKKLRSVNYDVSQFNSILDSTFRNMRYIKSQRNSKDVKILILLDKIIPMQYFGTTNNRKFFYRIVEKILTQSCYECIYKTSIIAGYNYDYIPWLSHISDENTRKKILWKTNICLLDCVVKPLIVFYYKPLSTLKGNEIRFVRVEKWVSFRSKVFNQLKDSKFLTEIENNHNVKARGYLKLIPKGNLEDRNFRIIFNSFRNDYNHKEYVKRIISKIYKEAREYQSFVSNSTFFNIYDVWSKFVEKAEGRKIFGIKVDVKDAYGNVNINSLTNIIQGVPKTVLNQQMKDYVKKHIQEQYVCFGKNVFRWNHGLLQGDSLSGCLCEIYMAYWDKTFFSNYKSEDSFLHRTVDDYFFCSFNDNIVDKFRRDVATIHKINENKTKTNLEPYNTEEIPYCGNLFNLANGQVKTYFNFDKHFPIRHRFKIWNPYHEIPEENYKMFLNKAMEFSFSSNNFTKMVMNTVFNLSKTVVENFFDGMVFVAYKFDAVVMALNNTNSLIKDFNFVLPILDKCCNIYSFKALNKIKNFKGQCYDEKVMRLKFLKTVAYKAFIVVLKRRSEVYKELIENIECVQNLKFNLRSSGIDFRYFEVLPLPLRTVKINRKNIL